MGVQKKNSLSVGGRHHVSEDKLEEYLMKLEDFQLYLHQDFGQLLEDLSSRGLTEGELKQGYL